MQFGIDKSLLPEFCLADWGGVQRRATLVCWRWTGDPVQSSQTWAGSPPHSSLYIYKQCREQSYNSMITCMSSTQIHNVKWWHYMLRKKMNVLLLQEHCEKIIPCPQSILKGGDNDNIIGILQNKIIFSCSFTHSGSLNINATSTEKTIWQTSLRVDAWPVPA